MVHEVVAGRALDGIDLRAVGAFFDYYLTFAISPGRRASPLARGRHAARARTMARIMTALMFVRPGDLYDSPIELDLPQLLRWQSCFPRRGGQTTDDPRTNATAEPLELTENGAELSSRNAAGLHRRRPAPGHRRGSTTVKLAVIDASGNLVYANYERHHTDIRATAKALHAGAQRVVGTSHARLDHGSRWHAACRWLDLEFVQEVIAPSAPWRPSSPDRRRHRGWVARMLSIIYFDNGIEQRMNGTCAGGTGAFIDQMATLLKTDAMA